MRSSPRPLPAGEHPFTSRVGIALALASIVVMPLLGRAKQRLGRALDARSTIGEGAQNLLCAYMAAGVLVGLLANTLLGAWWLDPLIGLAIAALAVLEGIEALEDEDGDQLAVIVAERGAGGAGQK